MTKPGKKRGPIETKFYAGGGGFAIGTQLSNAILWCLGVWVWGAPSSGPRSDAASAFVPQPWRDLIIALVPLILGLVAFYIAPHTPRPDLEPKPVQDVGFSAPTVQDTRLDDLFTEPVPTVKGNH